MTPAGPAGPPGAARAGASGAGAGTEREVALAPEPGPEATAEPGREPIASPTAELGAERTHCLLLSGGLDSTTLAAWIAVHHPGEPVDAYTFLYGQKHSVEREAAEAVAAHYGLPHHVVELEPIRGSALTDAHRALPEGRDLATVRGVAPSYVPARNLLFLARMAAMRDAVGPAVLWLGVHHDDHTGYPDCRPEFVEAADRAVQLGTRFGLRVRAPFVHRSKADIVRWGLEHGVPYELTHSCYQGLRPACGVCDTCQARRAAFAAAGAVDPIAYADGRGLAAATGVAPAEAAGRRAAGVPAGSGRARP